MSFGQFERTHSSKPMSDINMTPLVDVMLVLVVIFIVTAPLLTSTVSLDLPKTDTKQPSNTSEFITIAIDKGGQIFLHDQITNFSQLTDALVKAAQINHQTEVQLHADEAVPYGKVVEVMGVAQKAGLSRIGFVANRATAPAK